MENFVVSARKYRPTGFDEVVGQEHITTTLKNAIDNNKLAQALLFCGPRGVGKTTCARIVARLINGFGARRRARRARRALDERVAAVADELVLAPLEAELAVLGSLREALQSARGGRRTRTRRPR